MLKNMLIGVCCSFILFSTYLSGEQKLILVGYALTLLLTSIGIGNFFLEDPKNSLEQTSRSRIKLILTIIFLLTAAASPIFNFIVYVLSLGSKVAFIADFLTLPALIAPFFLSFLASYYYFIQLVKTTSKKNNHSRVLIISIWISYCVYTTSITLSFIGGNGFSPSSASPLYIAYLDTGGWTRDAVKLLIPHLQWYDYLLLVSVITPSDGLSDYESYYKDIYQLDSDLSYEETLEYLEANHPGAFEQLQRGGKCNFQGKEQSPQISLPTRTYFGLYYKNFLVSCKFVDFAADIGVGSSLPRAK